MNCSKESKKVQHYVHHVPGRLRIKAQCIKEHAALEDLVASLGQINGVEHVKPNRLTGSLTVCYDAEKTSREALYSFFADACGLHEAGAVSLDQDLSRTLSSAGEKLGRACLGVLVEKSLKGTGFSFLAALL